MKASLLVCLLAVAACAREVERQAPEPARVTVAEFRSLAWLEGRWRGTLNDTAAFYEEYRFRDDSTIATATFADSTLARVSDSGQVRLSGGMVTTGDDASGYVLTALDSTFAHFMPRGAARNAFTWRRQADGSWTARLTWRDGQDRPMERVYVMRRLAP